MAAPLEGVRVVDLTRVVAGPFCTSILADMGAEVIKIELPGRGDDGRYGYPAVEGEPVAFLALNRNKKGITLDVRTDDGKRLLRRLLAHADVLAENFAAGTMDRWGLGFDALHAEFPRLVYGALSGFGHTGPYAHRTSYDIIAQAMGGLMSLTGFPDGPPVRGGGSLGDFIGGMALAIGILSALRHQQQTGEGQLVDVSNMDVIFSMLDNWPTLHAMTGRQPERWGNRHPFTAPYDCHLAKDGYVVIGVGNNQLFRTLMEAIGQPELGRDDRFRKPAGRLQRNEEINRIVGAWVAERTVDEVMAALGPEGANVPCAPVMDVARLRDDPQIAARNMVVPLPHPQLGQVPVTGLPVKLSATPGRLDHLGPALGQHNADIYGALLGLPAAEMERLRSTGVI
jgi:crotonobetainyl-CoA:carnitine CoA-transferase CaiB-like acyl-CoA transferase